MSSLQNSGLAEGVACGVIREGCVFVRMCVWSFSGRRWMCLCMSVGLSASISACRCCYISVFAYACLPACTGGWMDVRMDVIG